MHILQDSIRLPSETNSPQPSWCRYLVRLPLFSPKPHQTLCLFILQLLQLPRLHAPSKVLDERPLHLEDVLFPGLLPRGRRRAFPPQLHPAQAPLPGFPLTVLCRAPVCVGANVRGATLGALAGGAVLRTQPPSGFPHRGAFSSYTLSQAVRGCGQVATQPVLAEALGQ